MHPYDRIVHAWANGAHYNAMAVEQHVNDIRQQDPNALIVILGDHAPVLGANLSGYRAGGRIAEGGSAPNMRDEALYETPLLIFDGDHLLRIGKLPTWQLPEVLLNILSEGAYCAQMRCASEQEVRLRPYYDFAMLIDAETGRTTICEQRAAMANAHPDPACLQALTNARAMQAMLARLLTSHN